MSDSHPEIVVTPTVVIKASQGLFFFLGGGRNRKAPRGYKNGFAHKSPHIQREEEEEEWKKIKYR